MIRCVWRFTRHSFFAKPMWISDDGVFCLCMLSQRKPFVQVTRVVEDEELVSANKLFEEAMGNNDLKGYCTNKVDK